MLYRKYMLYGDNMEIMVPSHLKMTDAYAAAGYNWLSDNRRVTVNVAKGGDSLDDGQLYQRLNEYYKQFGRNMTGFECKKILKRMINGRAYGELCYISDMSGYRFYNIFMLGSLEKAELVINLQCMDSDSGKYRDIFANVSASLRLYDENKNHGGSAHDS